MQSLSRLIEPIRNGLKLAIAEMPFSRKILIIAGLPLLCALPVSCLAFWVTAMDGVDENTYTLVFTAVASVLISVSVGLTTFHFMNLALTSRLRLLVRLTEELSRSGKSTPLVAGKDELAQLDRFIRRLVANLDEANKREQAVVYQAGDAICSLTRDGNIIFANPAAYEMWSLADNELIGRNIAALLAPETVGSFTTLLQTIKPTDGVAKVELVSFRQDNTPLFLLVSVSAELGRDRMFCIFHDITERKKAEQLRQQFLAIVSHDLRSPLNAMQLTLDNLRNGLYGELSHTGALAIERSEAEVARLMRLINSLLDYDKLESGEFQPSCELNSIEKLIRGSIEAIRVISQTKCVEINYSGVPIKVLCDADKVMQVIINLLSNAIKYSPPRSVISVKSELDRDEQVRISVKDSGKGITAELHESIFDRYRQASSEDARSGGGFGLGLAICKMIVEKHGGQIGVESEPGKGSTFWFSIPILESVSKAIPSD
jgi:PAS domain S-box-containing protein